MNSANNSRRNFLSTLAILTSGTVVATSPANIFDTHKAGNASLKKNWAAFVKLNGASNFLDLTGKMVTQHQEPIVGQRNVAGDIVQLRQANLLAQPSWIFWQKNSRHPDDVVVHFFESDYPYKKVKSINRFELQALMQLPADAQYLSAICSTPGRLADKQMNVKTRISKNKAVQDVRLVGKNYETLSQEQFFYNV